METQHSLNVGGNGHELPKHRLLPGISALVGPPGRGKTLTLTWLGLCYLEEGWEVWSNYGLEGARRLESLEDLEKSHGGMLALDEAWTLADSRRAMSAGAMAVDAVILKARKRGLDSVLVAQDFGMLDVQIGRAHV